LSATEPFFGVGLQCGNWAFEAEWPDGSIELIDTFSDYFEALNWVSNQAAAWIIGRKSAKLSKALCKIKSCETVCARYCEWHPLRHTR
jgi:hypothetical protein